MTPPTVLRRRVGAVLAAALLVVACEATAPAAPFSPAAPAAALGAPLAPDRIQILHSNDIHGHLEAETVRAGGGTFERGGMALMAGAAAQLRARAPDRTLLLDAGDMWTGTFTAAADRGAAMVRIMNRMGYHAAVLGNHDFDWGLDVLRARASEARFPLLAANIVEESTGNPPAFARPYVVKDLGLTRLAVIGVAHPATPTITKASNVKGLRFLPAAEAVRRYLPELRRQADVIVAVTHIGKDDDQRLAKDVPELDVIVGGHSHPTVLYTALLEGKTAIVNTGTGAVFLGRLEVTIDPQSRTVAAVSRVNELVTLASGAIAPDAEVAALVVERAAAAKATTDRVVGRTTERLDYQSFGEFPLGNLIADAMLEYCRAQGWRSDLALYNDAGVRAGLPAGDVTYGQVYQVLPFDNVVVSIDLSGAQLGRIFERTVTGRPGNLLVSGAAYAFRYSAEAGKRITSVTVASAPLETSRTYHVCTIDYLALGGDDQTTFREGTNLLYGDLASEVFADHLTKHAPVAPKVEGRIKSE